MNKLLEKKSDDRVVRYFMNQLTQSPKLYYKKVRAYWLLGIVFNLIGTVFVLMSLYNVLDKNANSTLNLVRVDGVRVQEAFDVRRDVLIRNSQQRARLRNNEE